MKVVVIGCTHAGTAAIDNLKKADPAVGVTVYERNDNISFLSCGIALYVGGVVKDPQGLFYSSPQKMAEMGVQTKMRHDVTAVDLAARTLRVRNLETGAEFEDNYDKLIITTGSWPVVPDIPGVKLENILLAKNYQHAQAIIAKAESAQRITIVGAGYIGVELAEAFQRQGKTVTLIDGAERILSPYLDRYFTDYAEQTLRDHGIRLMLGQPVTGFTGWEGKVAAVQTAGGNYETDLVIFCIGFKPNTGLFRGQVEMLDNGAIVVDEYMRTSRPDVSAAGDCCAVIYNPTGRPEYIPLATNAVRMGTLAARNLIKPALKYLGTQGTSGIKIYDYNIAATGLTEERALALGMAAGASQIVDNYRPEFMPNYEAAHLKVVFDKTSRRILGAQILSKADLTQSINTLSVGIQKGMTLDELAFVDFFFQPHYNKPWNFLNAVALQEL